MKIERALMDIISAPPPAASRDTGFRSAMDSVQSNQQPNERAVAERPRSEVERPRSEPEHHGETPEVLYAEYAQEEPAISEEEKSISLEQQDYNYNLEMPVIILPDTSQIIYPEAEKSAMEYPLEIIAETLHIPLVKLEETLEQAKIELVELTESKVQQNFVKALYQVEEPVELLKIEGIPKVIEQLEKIVEEVVVPFKKIQEFASKEEVVEKIILEEATTQETTVASKVETSLNQEGFTSQEQTETDSPLPQVVTETKTVEVNTNTEPVFVQQVQNTPAVEAKIAAPPPIPQAPIAPAEIMEQVKGFIKTNLTGLVNEVRMLLTPEHLGEINLKILTQNGIVTAQFVAASQRIKEIIESNLNDLRKELEDQGIKVGEIDVSVSQDNRNQLENFLKEQEKSQARISNIIKNIMEEETEEALERIKPEGTTVDMSA